MSAARPALRVETDGTPQGTRVFAGLSREIERGVQLVKRVGRKTYVLTVYPDAEVKGVAGDFEIALPGFSLQTKENSVRTLEEVQDQFAYHPATPTTATTHNELRAAFATHAAHIWELIPDGPEKTLAMRKLQESLMYANLAVAMTAPVDTLTPGVARVLPE